MTIIFLFDSVTSQATGLDSLKYFGHSFVQIKTNDDKNIYIDPFDVNALKDSADVVLITHEHDDHTELFRLKQKKNCTIIRAANAIENGVYKSFLIGNVSIKAVPAYGGYHNKSECVGFVLEFNGIKLYHAGDTELISEMADLAKENITYALLPMDEIYTMTPEQATTAASRIKAKYDIPIHTMPPPDTYSDAIVARFTSPNKLIVKPLQTIALSNVTSVEELETIPTTVRLHQNYPNPFNPTTVISYTIPSSESIVLKIFDALGREVTTLVNKHQSAGNYKVEFDGNNLSNGIYFCRLTAGSYSVTNKIILQK